MKKIFIIFIIFFSYFSNSIAEERIKKLNQLFDDLKTQNYSAAYKIEQEIWQIWSTHPNDENLTMLLNKGSSLVNELKYNQAIDILDVDVDSFKQGFDSVYGFQQGSGGDVIDLRDLVIGHVSLLPVILSDQIPLGNINNHILLIVDPVFTLPEVVDDFYNLGDHYSNLLIYDNSSTFLIGSPSTQTGADQHLFKVNQNEKETNCMHLASFFGNFLDIDSWTSANFLVPEALITA